MSTSAILDELLQQWESLPPDLQRQVLHFARALALLQPKGIEGQQLLDFSGAIGAGDLETMKQTIEDGCEQIDAHEW